MYIGLIPILFQSPSVPIPTPPVPTTPIPTTTPSTIPSIPAVIAKPIPKHRHGCLISWFTIKNCAPIQFTPCRR